MKILASIFALLFILNTSPTTASGVYQLELLWEIHFLSARCTLIDEQYVAFKRETARELEAAGYDSDRLANTRLEDLGLPPTMSMDSARCQELVRPLMSAYLQTLE